MSIVNSNHKYDYLLLLQRKKKTFMNLHEFCYLHDTEVHLNTLLNF